jgi:MOSC domain-containing protein YiiM
METAARGACRVNVTEPALEGKVVAVCAEPKHRFSKAPRLSVTLFAGLGVEGDAHFGSFVKHRYLARRNPRAPNIRQVHLIPVELLHELQAAGYHVGPGDLGDNITTAGLDLEELPLDTELRIGSAVIRLTGLRTPCVLIDRFRAGLKTRLVAEVSGPPFRVGVMADVTRGGLVAPRDNIEGILPPEPRR